LSNRENAFFGTLNEVIKIKFDKLVIKGVYLLSAAKKASRLFFDRMERQENRIASPCLAALLHSGVAGLSTGKKQNDWPGELTKLR